MPARMNERLALGAEVPIAKDVPGGRNTGTGNVNHERRPTRGAMSTRVCVKLK